MQRTAQLKGGTLAQYRRRPAGRAPAAAPPRACAEQRREEARVERTLRALDAAAATIGRLLTAGDIFGATSSPRRRQPEPLQLADTVGPSKRVSFRTRASANRTVAAPPPGSEARALSDYLQLPSEQYSLLDPTWVSRTGPTSFRVALPLGAIVSELFQGAPPPSALAGLIPAVTVTTAVEQAARRVVLTGSDASLGTAAADAAFFLTFTLNLGWQPPQWNSATWRLRAEAAADGWIAVPPPLARLPGPLLRTAGGLLAAAVAQAMLPRFVQVLAEDYAAWAAGDARMLAEGTLAPQLPAPGAAAAAESGSAEPLVAETVLPPRAVSSEE